jgi:uncharacterized membrane protein YgcG
MKHFFIVAAMLLAAATAGAQDTIPKPDTKILDQSGLLKPDEKANIQTIVDNFYKSRKGNAYLLIIDSLPAGQNIMAYTKGIFKKWDLNNEGSGLNFIIVYSRKEHGVRIEGSDKVIALVTKQYLQDVTNKSMIPYFQKRQDYAALKRGMEMVTVKIESNE